MHKRLANFIKSITLYDQNSMASKNKKSTVSACWDLVTKVIECIDDAKIVIVIFLTCQKHLNLYKQKHY